MKVELILKRRVESSLVILVLRILSISALILPSREERSSVILVLISFLILVISAVCNRRIDFYIMSGEFIGDFLFENHPHGNDPHKYHRNNERKNSG